jgi:hypothetical protein
MPAMTRGENSHLIQPSFPAQINGPDTLSTCLIRFFPGNSHFQGNRITALLPRELNPFRNHLVADLEIDPRLEGHLARFSAIQTHPCCRSHLALDFPGLRRNGSSSYIINQAQDFLEQAPRHRHLGQLKCDVPAMADYFRTDLQQFLL